METTLGIIDLTNRRIKGKDPIREENNRQYKKKIKTIKQLVEDIEGDIDKIKCTLRLIEKSMLFFNHEDEIFIGNT